jgi:ribosomal protein S18 acetylase RimI-like enzyme
VIRRAGTQDVPFLRDMLRHAYYWRWGSSDIPLGRYVDAWGRPGDTGLIAIEDFQPVGAGWFRLFPSRAPGYGFVDEETPELTVGIVPSKRGQGLGAQLLDALLDEARGAGYARISLSVEPESLAFKLYERAGFEKVEERGGTWIMVASL